MAAAGGAPETPSSMAVLCDLQSCTTEPARGTATAETKESAAEYNQQEADGNTGDGSNGIGGDDDDDNNGGFGYGWHDMANYVSDEDDDGWDERDYPPRSHMICYNGDSQSLNAAYSYSQYRVELFAVRPRCRFAGSFVATDGIGCHIWSSTRGHTVDPQNNLILKSSSALTDTFWIKIKIPGDNGEADDHHNGNFSFTVNPYACNNVITRTISTRSGRKIDMTFMALHKAIQANVYGNLDLAPPGATGTGTVYHVYGEITAHHELYDGESVVLFSRGEENKAEVIDGELPLSQKCAAVSIFMEPLLILDLDLHVAAHYDRDDEGHTIAFRDYITFYPDQYVKRICNADHCKVEVRISYQ